MKKTIVLLSITLSLLILNNRVLGQQIMTFKKATEVGLSPKLDSLYLGGVDSDSTKSVFKDSKSYIEAYQKFIKDLSTFLAKNNFKWGKEVRCFNRIYFSEKGTIDYFIYSFKEGQLTPEQEVQFSDLLERFTKTAKFALQPTKQFAQCSPVRYNDI